MQEAQQKKVLDAFQLVLRPIVKILLRYGIGYNQFAETVKTAFVDVGSTDFGIRGRPTNISRVAVMTGLTRKEVRRLRTKIEGGGDSVSVKSTPITEILTRWHSEDRYVDTHGRPLPLKYSGGTPSFSDLVKQFGGDVPPGAMRTELIRMELVTENEDGYLIVKSRAVRPLDSTDNLMNGLVHSAYPLMATIAKNSQRETMSGEGNAQFATFSQAIKNSDRIRLKRICSDRLAEVAVSFDDLFTAYESLAEQDEDYNVNPVVMVGLYYWEEEDQHAKYTW